MPKRLLVACLMLTGCGHGRKPVPSTTGFGGPMAAQPAQFSDLAPGDTSGVIDMMHRIMTGVDAGLGDMTQRDTFLPSVADSQPRHLSVWLDHDVVRKLVAADSGGNGPGAGETDVWFLGGDVAVIEETADIYAVDFGRIVLWTDASFVPRDDVDHDAMMARESLLMNRVRNWLTVFGLGIPD
ncbi:MAG: hypothetical protein ACREL5_02235 [Gemmatimonadales bacterium]